MTLMSCETSRKRMFLSCVDKHAPLRTKRVRGTKSPWINTTVKKLMHERDILKIKAIRTREHRDWLKFKKHRNFVNNQIKAAKRNITAMLFVRTKVVSEIPGGLLMNSLPENPQILPLKR